MNLPGQYAQYVKKSLEVGQRKYVKPVEIDLDKEKTMEKILIKNKMQLVKRASNGRFQQYMYTMKFKGDRLSLLIGIFMAEVIILLAII